MWFTSDSHFGHRSIIEFCTRPYADVIEMNQALVNNWNERIGKNDTVYHLGDFAFARADTIKHILGSLNGKIHLVKGNHDYKLPAYVFDWFESVENLRQIKHEGQSLIMCHFPILSWNKKHHGSWHLHGHSHGGLTFDPTLKRLDVGVDCHNYTPIHFEEIKRIFDDVETKGLEYKYDLKYNPHGHNGD